MSGTIFDDEADKPIQQGTHTPTNQLTGEYNPIQPLAQLIGRGSVGVWKLRITDSDAQGGSVTGFKLNLTGAQVGSGLGESSSDQSSAGFRIALSGGATTTGRQNWTPVGPAGELMLPPAVLITSISEAGDVVTVRTAEPHGLSVGRILRITGVNPRFTTGTM